MSKEMNPSALLELSTRKYHRHQLKFIKFFYLSYIICAYMDLDMEPQARAMMERLKQQRISGSHKLFLQQCSVLLCKDSETLVHEVSVLKRMLNSHFCIDFIFKKKIRIIVQIEEARLMEHAEKMIQCAEAMQKLDRSKRVKAYMTVYRGDAYKMQGNAEKAFVEYLFAAEHCGEICSIKNRARHQLEYLSIIQN